MIKNATKRKLALDVFHRNEGYYTRNYLVNLVKKNVSNYAVVN